jgi:DNA-binding response OmpR family regulator
MRMLLIEDEKKLSDLIERALKAERYAVDVAADGEAGWALADAYDYDLIILDLMLPLVSGTEVLRRIRRKNQQVPILILTARDATEEKVRHFEAGADDSRTK